MLTIEQIKQVFTKHGKKYGVKDAYLFGSYAKGEANEQSDVDILVGEDCINSYDDYYHLHEALEKDLERDVDLITMDGINPRFFNLIKDERISLYGT